MKLKKRKHSIRWVINTTFLVFIAIIIAVFWIFQVFFMDKYYVMVKENSLKDVMSSIQSLVYQENYEEYIDQILVGYDFCVTIYDESNQQIYVNSGEKGNVCPILEENSLISPREKADLIAAAIANNGKSERIVNFRKKPDKLEIKENFEVNQNFRKLDGKRLNENSSMTYGGVVIQNDQQRYIYINTQLVPVDATTETIKAQLVTIAAIMIIISIFLAYYLSQRIGKPVRKINQSAKALGLGNYDVKFEGRGYSEIEQLSDTLNYAAKELSKVDELRKDLIANMSHDLRTPLTMISGYGEVMRDIPGENTSENVQIIIDEAKRLTNLVNEILDLSKLQSGAIQCNLDIYNITSQCFHITKRYDKLLIDKDIHIEFDYDDHYFIEADEVKMSQVIYNLINNAINYCGKDKKVIVKQEVINDKVKISIIDHGDGISPDDLPYIWDRYYKVDKVHKRSQVGSGIGLSIVKSILELHHFEYGVTSELNKGTCFYFIVPIKEC